MLSPNRLAERYDVPVATIYSWRTKGYGPKGIRVGKHVRYSMVEIERWERDQLERVGP